MSTARSSTMIKEAAITRSILRARHLARRYETSVEIVFLAWQTGSRVIDAVELALRVYRYELRERASSNDQCVEKGGGCGLV